MYCACKVDLNVQSIETRDGECEGIVLFNIAEI